MHRHDLHHAHDSDHSHGQSADTGDVANRSLAEAMRSSFKVLKMIMVVVVILYIGSNVEILQPNEKAVVLRFGRLQGQERGPGGMIIAYPRPIDQIIKVPVTEKRQLIVNSQDLARDENGNLKNPGGTALDPRIDGSIMTGDRGLAHASWTAIYEISDLGKFVQNVRVGDQQNETTLIQHAVESAAVEVLGQMDAVDVVQNKIVEIQSKVRGRAQQSLDALHSGIKLAAVDAKPSWPKQTEQAFQQVTQAANDKRKEIDDAQQFRVERLNLVAGVTGVQLEQMFDEYLLAKTKKDSTAAQASMAQIEEMILNDPTVTGNAGERIQQARSYKKEILEETRADLAEFQSYLEEYQRNPNMLMNRLWTETQKTIFTNENVTKRHLPAGQKEIRLQLGPDPEEKKAIEEAKYKKQEKAKGDFSELERNPEDQKANVTRGAVLR